MLKKRRIFGISKFFLNERQKLKTKGANTIIRELWAPRLLSFPKNI
jgi:hypothetical protein